MNWQAMLKAAQKAAAEAKAISDGAKDGVLSEEDQKRYQEKFDEAVQLKQQADDAKHREENDVLLKELADNDEEDPDDQGVQSQVKTAGVQVKDRAEQGDALAFGDRFIKSDAYTAFRKAYPSGVGSGSPVSIGRVKVGTLQDWASNRKALIGTPIAQLQPTRMPTVDLVDRDRLTFLDLISRGRTDGNFEYVQITGVTRNAKIVPEATAEDDAAALKPLSDMQTSLADAKVYTYADGYDITNQMLSDAGAFASYMNQELSYSLDNVIEDKLLNGTGTNGEPRGILTTTGVQEVDYTSEADGADGLPTDATVKAFIRAVRLGILKVTRLPGGTVQAIVMSPEMDAAIDLQQDANERYYGNGPFGQGPGTLWGRPRVTSERLTDTNALLGDFRQVALLDREGLSVLAFNQHKDYAQRNLTYVRAELRAAQAIWKPNRLVLVKGAVAGG